LEILKEYQVDSFTGMGVSLRFKDEPLPVIRAAAPTLSEQSDFGTREEDSSPFKNPALWSGGHPLSFDE
jgi:hypothetical protein